MLIFNKTYFILTLLLLLTEICIGCYMRDAIIRPYGGDFLVVILLYCFIKSFINFPVLLAAAWVLFFAYAIEISQYLHLVRLFGLRESKIARILLGTSFSFFDMLTYAMGILLVIAAENVVILLKKI